MQPSKFVVKCGKFAILVDLHILPLDSQDNHSWFSQEHKEEVGALIRDAVEHRVKQIPEARQGSSKYRTELSPDNQLCLKGQTLRLAAYFMKRHVNLRCITQHSQEFRVFPERFVVCVSLLECAMAPTGRLNLDPDDDQHNVVKRITWNSVKPSGQNKSEYFSCQGETLDLLNSSTITKKATLQKIARSRQAKPQPGPEHKLQNLDQNQSQGAMLNQLPTQDGALKVSMQGVHEGGEVSATVLVSNIKGSGNHLGINKQNWKTKEFPEKHDRDSASQYNAWNCETADRRRKRNSSSPREDFHHQKPKRVCLREPSNGPGAYSDSTIATSLNSTTGPSSSHTAAAQVERVLEEELLTHGKQSLSLPLSNGTAKQTNQSRLATSLRGLSVKAVSSGSSISSRLAAKAEERVSAPRISRLRRLKKS